MSDKIHIVGTLKAVLYPRPATKLGTPGNAFGIIKVINDVGETYTIKGSFTVPLDKGTEYEFVTTVYDDEKYGETYKLIYFQSNVDFTDIDNQKGFLRQILTKKQVDALYSEYDDVLQILEDGDIEKLTKVKGIGASTANRMITKYKAAKPDMKLLAKLNDMGLEFTANLIERLKATFGNTDKVIDVLENEPYQLVKVPMIGFAKADEIALKSGKVSPQSPARIGGWIQYYLQDQCDNNGNSYVYASQLNTALIDYFGREVILYQVGGGSNIADAIDMLKRKNEINIIEDPTGNKARRKIYLQRTWELEHNIAIELRRIINAEPIIEVEEGWKERVNAQEEAQGFKFADEQREAIGKAINSNFFVIGGYAGTGKSTMLKGVLAALGDDVNIGTCALSGRAAANLQGIGANKTIHKLLDYRPGQGFSYKKGIPMPYDVVILDEMGMVGGPLFLSLIEAVKSGARVICLGDPAQLESIGSLCLMRDMLDSEYIPSVTLTQIHRQAAASGIISTAMDVRNGVCFFNQTMYEGIDIHGEKKDLCTDLTTLRDNIINRAVAWYKKMHSVYEPLDIMVIGFTNMRGMDSVYQLNKAIQEALGTHAKHERGKYFRGAYVGSNAMQHNIFKDDVVMCVKNNYNVSSYNDEDTIMFNGWRGVVEDITDQFVYINFKEANTKVKLDYATATEYITLGYAVTAHKSQGSTIPCVITVFSYSAYTMLNRNILYTAITRASKKCVVIAESAAYQKATQTEFVSQKNTFWRDGMLEEVLC